MQAWSDCAISVEPGTRVQPGIDNPMPADLRSEITTVLTAMILCLQQEAR